MKLILSLALGLALPTAHAADTSVDSPRLMRALEHLQTQVRPGALGLEVARGARLGTQTVLSLAGVALLVTYGAHRLPFDVVQRALVQNLRWAAWVGTSTIVLGAATWIGGHAFNAVMTEVYKQKTIDDRELYQTKKGLSYFFQLPLDEQFLYARQHAEFAEFLVSLSDTTELLARGFADPRR